MLRRHDPPLSTTGEICKRCGKPSPLVYMWRTCALGDFDLCAACDIEINAELLRLLRLAGREVSRLMKNYSGKVRRQMIKHERHQAGRFA
jgi:hypothetical protein